MPDSRSGGSGEGEGRPVQPPFCTPSWLNVERIPGVVIAQPERDFEHLPGALIGLEIPADAHHPRVNILLPRADTEWRVALQGGGCARPAQVCLDRTGVRTLP